MFFFNEFFLGWGSTTGALWHCFSDVISTCVGLTIILPHRYHGLNRCSVWSCHHFFGCTIMFFFLAHHSDHGPSWLNHGGSACRRRLSLPLPSLPFVALALDHRHAMEAAHMAGRGIWEGWNWSPGWWGNLNFLYFFPHLPGECFARFYQNSFSSSSSSSFSFSSSPILFASSGWQCAAMDPIRQGPMAVCTAGPHPPGSDCGVHRWTSSPRVRSQCAPLDLNRQTECQNICQKVC